MLTRALPLTVSATIAVILVTHCSDFPLLYYLIFPFLLLSSTISVTLQSKCFFFANIAVIGAIYLYFLPRHSIFVNLLLGLLSALSFLFFNLYYRRWVLVHQEALQLAGNVQHELEALTHKYTTRVENLSHLENQVVGLLALFELARDFSETLSFEAVADILYKKVLPQLPFRLLKLLLHETKIDNTAHPQSFAISPKGLFKTETEFTEEELKALGMTRPTDESQSSLPTWIFPLIQDDRLKATLLVEGAGPHDLAKFEVLCAYLPLQLRKIRLYNEVKELSIRDGLTGVFVRRHFLDRFDEEIKRSMKYHLHLAVLMLDIDHFKRYNDEYGHLAGDETLRQVSKIICDSLRTVDIVARYGGEEFVVVAPETRPEGAREVAERIRSNIARHPMKIFNATAKVTVSIGVSVFSGDDPLDLSGASSDMALELIRRADKALYHAKEEGRNQVVFFEDL